ncbi:MAG: hypothetical protein U0Q22_13740 [Acidimicrobiales bacterium]
MTLAKIALLVTGGGLAAWLALVAVDVGNNYKRFAKRLEGRDPK